MWISETNTKVSELSTTNKQFILDEGVNCDIEEILNMKWVEIPQEALEISLLSEVSRLLNLEKSEKSRIEKAIKKGYKLERTRINALSFMSGYTALNKEAA